MRTIPRRIDRKKHRGDYRAMCSCGIVWMRSRLFRDASGQLRCPDDRRGRDPVTLNRLNAAGALRQRPRYPKDGGNPDRGNDGEEP